MEQWTRNMEVAYSNEYFGVSDSSTCPDIYRNDPIGKGGGGQKMKVLESYSHISQIIRIDLRIPENVRLM